MGIHESMVAAEGKEFQVEIDTIMFTLRPVKRCPEMNRDRYGTPGECLGTWYDFQTRGANYRFCPKAEHAIAGLTENLLDAIKRKTEFELESQSRRNDAQNKQRRIDAALVLLETCEKIERLAAGDRQYLQGVKAAIAKAMAKI